jgi:hypothetical protein
MSRFLGWIFLCVFCVAGMAAAAPEQKAGVGPVCLYDSRSYSDGAYVCVQKSLMLMCSSDGAKATWKPVADHDLNERCTAPVTLDRSPEPHRSTEQHAHRHWRHALSHRLRPFAESSARCFVFVGKQYCE